MNVSTANKVAVFINFVFLDLTYNVGKTIINHPQISIFLGGMVSIPSHGWQMALFYPQNDVWYIIIDD